MRNGGCKTLVVLKWRTGEPILNAGRSSAELLTCFPLMPDRTYHDKSGDRTVTASTGVSVANGLALDDISEDLTTEPAPRTSTVNASPATLPA